MKTRSLSGRPTAVLRYRYLETPAVPVVVTEHGVEFELVELSGCDVDMGMSVVERPELQMTISNRWDDPGYYITSAPLYKKRNTWFKVVSVLCVCWFVLWLVVVRCCLAEI